MQSTSLADYFSWADPALVPCSILLDAPGYHAGAAGICAVAGWWAVTCAFTLLVAGHCQLAALLRWVRAVFIYGNRLQLVFVVRVVWGLGWQWLIPPVTESRAPEAWAISFS